MWIEYLNNPFGLRVGDCVVRAISKALDKSWEETYIDLCVQGFMMGDLPSSNSIWSTYLKHKGFRRRTIEDCPDCYSIEDFCRSVYASTRSDDERKIYHSMIEKLNK